MTQAKHSSFEASRNVLEQVARRLEADDGLRRSGVRVATATGAEGSHIERVSVSSANGSFELVAKDGGLYLGSLKEWPAHPGDEQHPDKAVGYLAALLRCEATGTAFHRVSVQKFTG